MRQVRARLVAVVKLKLAIMHSVLFELLLIDMHHNSTRKGLGLKYVPVQRHCLTLIKKNSSHKLIRVIRIFMLTIFMVQCYPRNIFNIELFPNYGT